MVTVVGSFLGGLGLFLLAVSMITDGLKLAAGETLRSILTRSTRTRWRGIASGVGVTAVVQSSSAVTIATIGFVNAGLLTLTQSLGIVYGANIGTTMTGWLVALMGFELNIASFALPLIGLGMLARLVGSTSRAGAFGEALAGFGLFFVGIDVLKDAFGGFATALDLSVVSPPTSISLVFYVAVGFLTTLVTQSSSAAIALTLTAATTGVLALDTAAAMVIGANVGTTSTAILAAIGATPNARRVAAAHVVFNLVTAVAALALLPLMLKFVALTSTVFGLADIPVVALALFHTTFNVLGVLLMLPFTPRLAKVLQGMFTTDVEALGRPVHLDRNIVMTPLLGLDALRLELNRMAAISRDHAANTIAVAGRAHRQTQRSDAISALTDAVEGYVALLQQQRMPERFGSVLPLALRINNYVEDVATLSNELVLRATDISAITRGGIAESIASYRNQTLDVLTSCNTEEAGFDVVLTRHRFEELEEAWHDLKSRLLNAASLGEIPLAKLNSALEGFRVYLKIAEQSTKMAERSVELLEQARVSFR